MPLESVTKSGFLHTTICLILGFEDFNPEIVFVSKVQGAKPRYEPHKTVLQKAGTWLYNQNLQVGIQLF